MMLYLLHKFSWVMVWSQMNKPQTKSGDGSLIDVEEEAFYEPPREFHGTSHKQGHQNGDGIDLSGEEKGNGDHGEIVSHPDEEEGHFFQPAIPDDEGNRVAGRRTQTDVHINGTGKNEKDKSRDHKENSFSHGIEKTGGQYFLPQNGKEVHFITDEKHIGEGAEADIVSRAEYQHEEQQNDVQKRLPVAETPAGHSHDCLIEIREGICAQIGQREPRHGKRHQTAGDHYNDRSFEKMSGSDKAPQHRK